METNENIERLCSYFKRQIGVIDSIQLDVNLLQEREPEDFQVLLYKKTLLLTMLDAMAGIRFPKKYYPELHDKNRKRFTRFIKEYANWNNGNLINVPFLFDRLSKSKNRAGRLAEHLKAKLSKFDTKAGGAISVDKIDEQPEVLLSFTRTEWEEKEIFECQHYSILYRYRNHLVHEAREPGNAMNFYSETDAYYHSYVNDPRWFLVYPLSLLKKLCSQSIDKMRQYLLDNQIDPYDYDIVKDTSRF